MRRNHRQKKENYISSLEAEVTRLREVIAQQQNMKVKEIQAENQALRDLLAVHRIPSPPSICLSSTSTNHDFVQISLVGEPGTGQHLEPTPVQDLATLQEQMNPSSSSDQPSPTPIPMPPDSQIIRDVSEVDMEAFEFVMRFVQTISISRPRINIHPHI